MNTAKIVKDAIANASRRFPSQVWAFMHPEVAADIKVAFAIEHVVATMATVDKAARVDALSAITSEIRTAVYGADHPLVIRPD